MEHPFKYLTFKYGEAGAREKFESICVELVQAIHEDDAYSVDGKGGDGGIDIFVGDYNDELDVYQCKYFTDKIDTSQKRQITDSFNKVISEKGNKINVWYLCVAKELSKKEHDWWATWKKEMKQNYNVKIKLWDAKKLEGKLKKYELYDRYFSNHKTKKEEFSKDFRSVISILSENPSYYEIALINHLDSLRYKWEADEYIINKDSMIFIYMKDLMQIVSFNSGKLMNNKDASETVTDLITLIIQEYKRLIKN